MQTFVPYPNFHKSAEALDQKRLGKQRVETLQILNTLAGISKGWASHPAVKMWRGYEQALVIYGVAITQEWRMRGYKDTCQRKIINLSTAFSMPKSGELIQLPPWWGDESVHNSHKSKLLQKDYQWYSQFGWDVPLDLEYVWPA